MKKAVKSSLFILAGGCWLLFAFGFGYLVFQYLLHGAGSQVFDVLGIYSNLIGLIQVLGLAAVAGLCFVVGMGLFVRGFVSRSDGGG